MPEGLAAFLLAAARAVPALAFAPLGGRLVPLPLRLAAAALLSLTLAPALGSSAPPWDAALVPVVAVELARGAILGLLASVPLLAVEAAGALVVPSGPSASRAADAGLLLGAVAFFALGGPLRLVESLASSYAWAPIGAVPAAAVGPLAAALGGMILSAVGLAAPALAAALFAELALSLAGRVAPGLLRPGLAPAARALFVVLVLAASAGALVAALGGVFS